MSGSLDFDKKNKIIIHKAIMIASIIDKHLGESECDHKLRDIMMEVLEHD
jgi:hypothetical protein